MKIYPKTLLLLTLTFLLTTVIGTLSHEGGHYTVARMLGYEAQIHYQNTSYQNPDLEKRLDSLQEEFEREPDSNTNSAVEKELLALREKKMRNSLPVLLGGPLQTILTGTLGFVLLLIYSRRLFSSTEVKPMGWILIFLSLFWLRQLTNLAVGLAFLLFRGSVSGRDDESKISYLLGLPQWTILVITSFLSAGVLLYVFRVLPQRLRPTFMLAGIFGGILGYYLWIIKFGKVILP